MCECPQLFEVGVIPIAITKMMSEDKGPVTRRVPFDCSKHDEIYLSDVVGNPRRQGCPSIALRDQIEKEIGLGVVIDESNRCSILSKVCHHFLGDGQLP